MQSIHRFVSQPIVSSSRLLRNVEGERGYRPFLLAAVAVRNDHEHLEFTWRIVPQK